MAVEDRVRAVDHPVVEFGGMRHTIRKGAEGTGAQTWKRGAPLKKSGGRLIECATDDVAGIVGLALANATGVTDAVTDYLPLDGSVSFEATLEDANLGDHALTLASLYEDYSFRKTAGGLWYLDFNDTTNVAGLVIALIDPIGTVQGRVRFVPLQSVTIYA